MDEEIHEGTDERIGANMDTEECVKAKILYFALFYYSFSFSILRVFFYLSVKFCFIHFHIEEFMMSVIYFALRV